MITTDLRGGNYPFIMMKDGGKGHVVVAYDLEESDETDIAYYIYMYEILMTPFYTLRIVILISH